MLKQLLMGVLSLGFFLAVQPAHAWSVYSHMTTGAIAYDDLASTSPETLSEVSKLVRAHPDYENFVKDTKDFDEAGKMRRAFEWMARWADDVRGTSADRPEWHYELRVVHGWTWLWPFRNGSARDGFEENFQTLSNPEAPTRDRALAVGWLMHIVGDMQQPLHAGHQLSSEFLATDEAGTISYVRVAESEDAIELHELWDQALDVAGDDFTTSKKWAVLLQEKWPRSKLRELTLYEGSAKEKFDNWVYESMYLAGHAYRNAGHKAAAVPIEAPSFTASEMGFVTEISKRRVATSGYRIAETLRMALK